LCNCFVCQRIRSSGKDDTRAKLKGGALVAIGRLPVTDSFGVYAKAGAFAAALDVDAFNEDETYDDVSPVIGAGVDFRITDHLTTFLEYNRYNVDIDKKDFHNNLSNDNPEFDTAQVGLKFQF